MALTTRQRTTLYTAIADAIGTEEAGLLLDQFPAREGDELITRDHLATGLAEVRTEIAEVRTEIAGVRTEIARMENRLYVAMVSISVVAIGVVTALTR
ncbi:MAG: hypothetical protein KDB10_18345 [Acidimicrobiales bacterium]|nr:hypothetical protein [Acidimicrobiales bacterium]MCB9372297.1 hypothetical protein [Microthrixaceae bacterium]